MNINITSHRKEYDDAFNSALERALNAIGIQLVSYAKRNLNSKPKRIDTGLLVNSITYALGGKEASISEYKANKPRKKGGEIERGSYSGQADADTGKIKSLYLGTNVEYAWRVHDGTEKMTANRFLKNALTQHKSTIKEILESELKNG